MSPVMDDISTSGTGATTANLVTRVRSLTPESTADLYTDAEIVTTLNDAKNWLFIDLDVLPANYTLTTTGAGTYSSPTDLNRWRFLKHDDIELTPIRMHELATFDTYIDDLSGTPQYYCPEFISSAGARQFVLKPTDASGNTLEGYYYKMPADLDLSGSNPSWHVQFHYAPCYYTTFLMLNKDHRGAASDRMLALAVAEKARYLKWFNRNFPFRRDAGRLYRPDTSDFGFWHTMDTSPIP